MREPNRFMRGSSSFFHPQPTIGRQPRAVNHRRIVTAAVVLAVASGVGWALIELGRPAERAPVPPIVVNEDVSAPRPGDEDPGAGNPDGEGEDPVPGEPGGSGGSPSVGAVPPPAPLPPPAGDDDDDDGDDDDDDDGDDSEDDGHGDTDD